MALDVVSDSKQMIGLKLIAHMWPFVLSVKTLYQVGTWLVLPLPKKKRFAKK